ALASSLAIFYSLRFLASAQLVFVSDFASGNFFPTRNVPWGVQPWWGSLSWIGGLVALHCLIGWLAINGRPSVASKTPFDTLVPRLLATVGASPFANLTGAELAKRPAEWRAEAPTDALIARIPKVALSGMKLRYASAKGSFVANADLS